MGEGNPPPAQGLLAFPILLSIETYLYSTCFPSFQQSDRIKLLRELGFNIRVQPMLHPKVSKRTNRGKPFASTMMPESIIA